MIAWLQQNWGNIVVVAVVALMVGAIIFSLIRAKKQGKSGCSCGCEHCTMSCHPNPKSKTEK